MNNDLTFNSVVFEKSFDQEGRSQRQSTARGPSTPDKLLIRNQEYVDPEYKTPGRQFQVLVERHSADATTGELYKTSFWVVARISQKTTSTDQSTALATFKAVIADANLMANVLNAQV